MRIVKIICDRCNAEIKVTLPEDVSTHKLSLGDGISYDLCPKCYHSLMRNLGNWMSEQKENTK